MNSFSNKYWNEKYKNNQTGWDVGFATPPFIEYINQLNDKNIKILVPGSGNGYEVEYLFDNGFENVYLLDFAEDALKNFQNRVAKFPAQNLILEDFFKHKGQYDMILEQTFFCSLHPTLRENYVSKIYELLKSGGKLAGLLFNHEFGVDNPPFGGTEDEYRKLFKDKFHINKMEVAYNSIIPRAERELFFILEKIE